jgi:hypothetical protein
MQCQPCSIHRLIAFKVQLKDSTSRMGLQITTVVRMFPNSAGALVPLGNMEQASGVEPFSEQANTYADCFM